MDLWSWNHQQELRDTDCVSGGRIVRSQASPVLRKLSGALTYLLRGLSALTQMRPRMLGHISTASCGDSTSLPATVIMRQLWRNLLSSACEVSTKVSDARLIASSN